MTGTLQTTNCKQESYRWVGSGPDRENLASAPGKVFIVQRTISAYNEVNFIPAPRRSESARSNPPDCRSPRWFLRIRLFELQGTP